MYYHADNYVVKQIVFVHVAVQLSRRYNTLTKIKIHTCVDPLIL